MSPSSKLKAADLYGAWLLGEFTVTKPDGTIRQPYGDNPVGTLVYHPVGMMSAVLCPADRKFPQTTFEDANQVSDKDKVAAFDSYVSYTGSFAVNGVYVEHTVIAALTPSVVGTTLRRRVEFVGSNLQLSYEYQDHQYRLLWRPYVG